MGLSPLDKDIYYEFAARLMKNGDKDLSKDVFEQVYNFAHGYTYYIPIVT